MLCAAKMARSTYFYHQKSSKINDKYSDLKQQIKVIYHQHKGRYGYRRITLALRNTGTTLSSFENYIAEKAFTDRFVQQSPF